MATNLSWGQIRLLLQQFAGPGISLDTIDQAIRGRYELILTQMDWEGVDQTGIIQSQAAYNAGAVVLTPGSTDVTGIGTNWTAAMSGWQLFAGVGPVYDVTIISPTSLILDRPYEGTGGGPYWIAKAFYELPTNCRDLSQIFSPWDGSELTPIDRNVFGELLGDFLPVGSNDPYGLQSTNYVPWTDGTNSQTGETVQRILIYPVPVKAQGYKIIYDAVATSFDGLDTTDGPLAFVSAAALIAGCKADLEMEKSKPNPLVASKFEADFNKWLLGMIHVENDKTPNQRMRLDDSYTQHRMARFLRSGGPVMGRDLLLQTTGDSLPTGAGTPRTDSFTGDGTRALFPLSQTPLTPVIVLVNNSLVNAANYVQAGIVLNFLAGSVPAAGATITVVYTF